jgi:UDP-N-acetylmuramoyl-L-alanyl-D-glutamate--2,6-diaminopimelate ligase
MEVIQSKPFKVIVDFAHTPNALEKALTTLRNSKPKDGRLIVVFGCAGKRDHEKRYLMGEVAGRLADVIVITSEDPRDEELALINNRIIDGVTSVPGWNMGNQLSQIETSLTHLYFRFDEMSINSRIDAIKFAIRIAKPNDIVVICGKGHEKSMCFETTEYPYSDQEVVKSILKI